MVRGRTHHAKALTWIKAEAGGARKILPAEAEERNVPPYGTAVNIGHGNDIGRSREGLSRTMTKHVHARGGRRASTPNSPPLRATHSFLVAAQP